MKKGQVQIIFTWIFILILAGAILVYGIKFVRNTQDLGEKAVIINFFQKLDDKVQLYYSLDEGSKSVEEFRLTNKVDYVCFGKNFMDFNDISLNEEEYIISLKDYDNVFLIPPINGENRIKISNLDLVKDECFKIKGGILKIKLETTHKGVKVEAA